MTPTPRRETTIDADPALPTIRIVRDFDAPRERVYRAWTDPELVVRWIGMAGSTLRLDAWEPRTGGRYRYLETAEDGQVHGFFGSFHELRPNERLVQTFSYEGFPDGVSLETITFTDLGDGRTRVSSLSVFDSLEARDGIIASGMEAGVHDSYAKLDTLLAGD
ncbi:SRPBCC family protein [Prauserella muralis]|uniref:Polyketide cyclase n=1 Tax=Prauserella muralis TaxID=588067 RepID=A0A2V4BB21_9PSEU|nr:SRPBCC family protein [Prauserella muralis]PXY32574.1 polyketide cyclase [Prauserella muralis]TWE23711.1 uncharacterized protein YndB with AHSA1/START domain [Prauserella muralis]